MGLAARGVAGHQNGRGVSPPRPNDRRVLARRSQHPTVQERRFLLSVSKVPQEGTPVGTRAAGNGYWFTPMPVYLLDAVFAPDSPVNAPAVVLWAHIHRHYAWRERVFPSYARLAEETGQSESAVKRQLNMLKAAGAITWGAAYRARGRSSNEYALAPTEPFRFDREVAPPVQVKSDLHSPVQVTSEPPVEVKSDPYPQVKNDLGVESSSYLESTDESLSPSVPTQRAVSSDGANERETSSPIDNPTTTTPLAAPDTPADRIIAAYTTVLGRPVLTRTRTALHQQATEALDAGYPEEWLTGRARELAAHGWSDLAKHIEKSTVPLPGTAPSVAFRGVRCPDHPARYRKGCVDCAMAVPA